METQFGQAEGTLAVQVIALVQPPASLEQAPLRAAFDVVLAAPVARRVLVLGGANGDWAHGARGIHEDWRAAGFDLIGQRDGDLGERMAGALADAYATAALPMLLIRTDTLDVTPDMLADAARSLVSGEADAAFGPASDGGFWLLGLRRPDRSLVVGVQQSGPAGGGGGGGRLLLNRLASAGLRVALAPRLEIARAKALRF